MPSWTPAGKHCFVTGGSQGLGLELSKLLVQQGAHVSIVARDKIKLDAAICELEKLRCFDDQLIRSYSFALNDGDQAGAAIDAAAAAHQGRLPDAFFMCAGTAHPGFFVEHTHEDLRKRFEQAYWVQAMPAHEAATRLVKQRAAKGAKIVLVGSTASYLGFIGYMSYSPGKHAVRGLADGLRHELQLYGVDVQLFSPPTIYTPGYEEENRTKPAIVLKLEERDEGVQPEKCAQWMLHGIKKGHPHITGDFINTVLRTSMRGAAEPNNSFIDFIYECIGVFALPSWRRGTDKVIKNHALEHEEYLKSKGFYDA
jgi:3-dehydrosphinganine reductase